jgi:signal transduction histidine kinase
MPEMEGTALLEQIKTKHPDTVRMLITAFQEVDIATDAINKGNAYQLIYKPWNQVELKETVRKPVTHYESKMESLNVQPRLSDEIHQLKSQNQSLTTRHHYFINRLNHSHKMETLGNLASGIAHDFNNTLLIINGYLELATLEPCCPLEVRQKLEIALEASQRAKDLIHQIFAYRRKSENIEHAVCLAPLVEDALILIRAALPAAIEIDKHIMAKHESAKIDPTNLYQLILNLCANAAEAMEGEHGKLRVSLTRTTIGERLSPKKMGLAPGSYLKLTVSDNGRGISADNMKQIFDPFYTTKKERGGTGLGLALVDQIVKAHGGKLTVQSVLDKGSDFNVYLPLSGQQPTILVNG